MTKIGAIETRYAGHLFRSRLEARWAVFFDECGLEWRYESEGFACDGGFRYLPDFYLPKARVWVEVKGDPMALENDQKRMRSVLGEKSPLPGYLDGDTPPVWPGLLVLGEVPRGEHGLVAHRFYRYRPLEGIMAGYGLFASIPNGTFFIPLGDGILQVLKGVPEGQIDSSYAGKGWRFESVLVGDESHYPAINSAYQAARSARFEHGQSGAV